VATTDRTGKKSLLFEKKKYKKIKGRKSQPHTGEVWGQLSLPDERLELGNLEKFEDEDVFV